MEIFSRILLQLSSLLLLSKPEISNEFQSWWAANENNIHTVQRIVPENGNIESIVLYPELPASIAKYFEVEIRINSIYPAFPPLNQYTSTKVDNFVVWRNQFTVGEFDEYPCLKGYQSGLKMCVGTITFKSDYLSGTGLLDFPTKSFQVSYQFQGNNLSAE